MEHEQYPAKQKIQQSEGVMLPSSFNTASKDNADVPATLLSGVLNRLEQREMFLVTHHTLPELLDALRHPQWEIRAGAVRELGKLGAQVPLDTLLTALQDEHRMVRLTAVRVLGEQGGRVPLTQLAAALHDDDHEVREMAELVLQQAGRPQGYAPTMMDPYSHPVTVTAFLRHLWYVFAMQAKVLHRSWWLGTLLVMLLACMLAMTSLLLMHSDVRGVALLLSLFTTISAATGTAFLYGVEHDEGFELMLATPTSIRLVMLCRFVWVVGANLLFSAAISALIALVHGGGLWTIMQVWLSPMLLVASFTLALSMLLGSWLSILAGILLEASQILQLDPGRFMPTFAFHTTVTWFNSPLALLLAALCLCIALLGLPRNILSKLI